MMKMIYCRNCVYQTAYHVVWCPKYRKPILEGEVAESVNKLIDTICEKIPSTNRLILSRGPNHKNKSIQIGKSISPILLATISKPAIKDWINRGGDGSLDALFTSITKKILP